MPRSDPQSAFFFALEENPGDSLTLQALADWYEEQGQSDNAACLRWVVKRAFSPFRYSDAAGLTVSGTTMKPGWLWWAIDDPIYGSDWGHPRSCRLPRTLWKRLRHSFEWEPLVFKHYETVREAFEALFAVWPLVSPADRERSS